MKNAKADRTEETMYIIRAVAYSESVYTSKERLLSAWEKVDCAVALGTFWKGAILGKAKLSTKVASLRLCV
jgi:hypothetical protein